MILERLSHEPSLEPPEVPDLPHCPCCGSETDTFLQDDHGTIVGCDNCVSPVDAWDYVDD